MLLRFHYTQSSGRFDETARIGPRLSSVAYFLVFLFFPYGRSAVSRSIGEALPDDTFDCPLGALYVIYAKPHAIAISEIELRQIAVQVLLAAMLIDAFLCLF
jgi:hypothetical protein